jgi:N-formylglutamate amidohydrolase
MEPFSFQSGQIPLLISFPHNGTAIPPDVAAAMTDAARTVPDTDWDLDRLYNFPESQSACRLVANFSRYVIDLNRPSDDQSLYPGQTTTGLVPDSTFAGQPIYRAGLPAREEIARRLDEYYFPYHLAIQTELTRMKSEFGIAVLLDAHSIRSRVPRLFDGVLPDFNFGTNHGTSCDDSLTGAIVDVVQRQQRYSYVLNGRFVGGHITRHYGQPANNVHAIQIELSQSTYLDEQQMIWDDVKANHVRFVSRDIVSAICRWIQSHTY